MNNKIDTKVSVIKCKDYEEQVVENAVRKALELIGGLEVVVKQDDKVLLKVNLLAPAEPKEAVTTHPAIVKSMIKIVKEVEVSLL